jgi:tetratricopeptide (TPR) repeat protein
MGVAISRLLAVQGLAFLVAGQLADLGLRPSTITGLFDVAGTAAVLRAAAVWRKATRVPGGSRDAETLQALTLHQQLGNHLGQAHTWDSLGYAHHHLGHRTQAITCYQHAIDLFRDLGGRYDEAATLTRLGDTHHATGNTDAARDAFQQALTILTDLDHTDAEAVRTKLHQLDRPAAATPRQHHQPQHHQRLDDLKSPETGEDSP